MKNDNLEKILINGRPEKQGLYDPLFEKDACGVGFLCHIKGEKSHLIVRQSLEVLRRLAHRGATGADPKTGDGAGILIQIPDDYFRRLAAAAGVELPAPGAYGSGLIFLPTAAEQRQRCKEIFSREAARLGLKILFWRTVPVDNSDIGLTARETEPTIEQIFIGREPGASNEAELEIQLYLLRKLVENAVRDSQNKQKSFFYIPSLSSRTFAYKGLLMPEQVDKFFLDLRDPEIKSALCLVHSRYSTNTFPTWDLAQPFRFLAHNGEINTLRGNINWMAARSSLLESAIIDKKSFEKIWPVIVPGGSDSAALDNVFEMLVLAGRPIEQVMMMLIPSAWQQDIMMDQKLKDFYEYHACLMEPWDGPAAIAFTDGTKVGAVLDRNGLRPARIIVTKDDFVVMASEVGVLDIEPEKIKLSGRLEPGKMFFIDTARGRIVDDRELKEKVAGLHPYGRWLKENIVKMENLPSEKKPLTRSEKPIKYLEAFGYTREDLKFILNPMADHGAEPTGAMGNDTPLAVLSQKPQLLYSYFKQLFAQVTNPPIDPIREEIVMSLELFGGPEKNILDETPEHCHKLKIKRPVLTNSDLEKIKNIKTSGFKTKTISLLFNPDSENNLPPALENISAQAEAAIKDGFSFIVLSDRGVGPDRAAIPALLAMGAVQQHLVNRSLRTQIGIILESGEPREVHHFALLFGFGADAINPYLAYEAIVYLIAGGQLKKYSEKAVSNYRQAVEKGLLKILSKMGISTLQGYRGAQIFEALGLHDEVIERCFTGTVSRIGGADFQTLARETLMRHAAAFKKENIANNILATGGLYQWKKDGEFHLWNPRSIVALQESVRAGDYQKYLEFAGLINDQSKNPTTLRSLLKFSVKGTAADGNPVNNISLDEVEPVSEIVKRFVTGAMSFGSISRLAHETIALAMNRLKAKSNTGEGGEDPARFIPRSNGDSVKSAIKQVASGRFGVTTNYLVNADEIQIKMAQGAKPGEGGQLPGHKVSAIIARTRYTTPGVTLISPPPHHDIYSIEDLAQLIFDLKNVNPLARISVKLVSEIGVGTVAAGVAKGHADMILISGGDGGTGASPLSSIKHAGLPWELGLSETHQTLVLNNLRRQLRLQTDGQMRTGRDVAIAAMLGADEFGFCTAALIVMGCVMLRHCNLNNCSVGIATQDEVLEKRFCGQVDYLVNYFQFVARELRQIMADLGVRKVEDLVGRTELLEINQEIIPWKARKIDFSRILYRPEKPAASSLTLQFKMKDETDLVLDRALIEQAQPALQSGQTVKREKEIEIKNVNRTTGAMLSGEVCRKYGENGLPADTINFKFHGMAGQSFGAFLAGGVTFELEGLANDYVGKAISGGKIIIYPDKKTDYRPEDNIIIGNTTFYGAINGEAYIRGQAGERFCIRNSGLNAVVEGVGDHGCEYMTGGRVVILGKTGRNFAAGMSGGIAYIYDTDKNFRDRCNLSLVELDELDPDDKTTVTNLLEKHLRYTGSQQAKNILDNLSSEIENFVKVIPVEYRRILKGESPPEPDLESLEDGE